MAFNVIFESVAVPSINAMSPETAAEFGAQYIWDMFGESIDGKTVQMTYSNHPSATRANWIGIVREQETRLIGRESTIEDRMQFVMSELFTFSLDAVTGERIGISNNTHWAEPPSEEVRVALDELFGGSNGMGAEEVGAIRRAFDGTPPAQLDDYIEAAREFAQRHFNATEVVSVKLININVIAFDLDENGNLFAANHQLIFEVTDSTGRVADMAIIESTKQLIRLNTGMNDIVPGWNYVGTEPGRG